MKTNILIFALVMVAGWADSARGQVKWERQKSVAALMAVREITPFDAAIRLELTPKMERSDGSAPGISLPSSALVVSPNAQSSDEVVLTRAIFTPSAAAYGAQSRPADFDLTSLSAFAAQTFSELAASSSDNALLAPAGQPAGSLAAGLVALPAQEMSPMEFSLYGAVAAGALTLGILFVWRRRWRSSSGRSSLRYRRRRSLHEDTVKTVSVP